MLDKLVKLLDDFKTPVTLNGEWLCDYKIPTSQIRKELAQYLIDNNVRLDSMQATSEVVDVHFGIYDKEETYENCTVQVLTNTVTGDVSVGWWQNE